MFRRSIRTTALSLAVLCAPAAGLATPGSEAGPPAADNGLILGLGAGALVGGLIAGPPGAVAGLFLGGATGDAVHRRAERDELQQAASAAEARSERLAGVLAAAREDNRLLTETRAELEEALAARGDAGDVHSLAGALTMDVLFRTGEATLRQRGRERLNALAGLLARHPELGVTLVGHADRRGARAFNQALSERRAEAVRAALVAAGVDGARLRVSGVGERRALAAARDADGLALDRRVAVRLHPAAPSPGADGSMAAAE